MALPLPLITLILWEILSRNWLHGLPVHQLIVLEFSETSFGYCWWEDFSDIFFWKIPKMGSYRTHFQKSSIFSSKWHQNDVTKLTTLKLRLETPADKAIFPLVDFLKNLEFFIAIQSESPFAYVWITNFSKPVIFWKFSTLLEWSFERPNTLWFCGDIIFWSWVINIFSKISELIEGICITLD